jgi:hypothetical protein
MKKMVVSLLGLSLVMCSSVWASNVPVQAAQKEFIRHMLKLQAEKKGEQYAPVAQEWASKKEVVAALTDVVVGFKKVCAGATSLVELIKNDPKLGALVMQELAQVRESKPRGIELDQELRKKLASGESLSDDDAKKLGAALEQAQVSTVMNGLARIVLFAATTIDELEKVGDKTAGDLADLTDVLAEAKEAVATKVEQAMVLAALQQHAGSLVILTQQEKKVEGAK